MKILVIIVRTLLGLLFLFASVTYFFNLIPAPELTGNVKLFMDGVLATGYFMTLLKGTELVCGLLLVTGYFVPLAVTMLAPIALNIFLFHYFVDPAGIGVAIFVISAEIFLAYAYRDNFKPLLTSK